MKYQNKQDGKTYERIFVVIQNDAGLVQIVGITGSRLKAIGLLYDFAQELIVEDRDSCVAKNYCHYFDELMPLFRLRRSRTHARNDNSV